MRIERDSMGAMQVPDNALWGAQTARAVANFPLGGGPMPAAFVRALALVKWAAAGANASVGVLDADVAEAIRGAALGIVDGDHEDQFPVDVYQTGSGTSSNMNANEVIAALASRTLGRAVHPNDHVNASQSSNDVIPTALHVSAACAVRDELLPALADLAAAIESRASAFAHVVKTGRTHLMDAMPVRLDQELGAWASQVRHAAERIDGVNVRLCALAIGGTAVGSGINAPPGYAEAVCAALAARTGIAFRPADDRFEALACQDTAVELAGQLKVAAVALMKIANDLRWMNSGPLAGLGEIELAALQPGSSIMPGKVNPVIPEAVAMVAARVIGADATITIAGQSGNFQLNVMLPLIASELLEAIARLAAAARVLGRDAIAGMAVRRDRLEAALARNPILVTALNARIGYEQGAAIAKRAYAEGRAVLDVAVEVTGIDRAELERLLDPAALTRGGVPGRSS